jgi:type II restriction/modification system DNA methylase subunit YeeA
MELDEARKFEKPIEYVAQNVKPERDNNNRARRREKWWQHGETVPGLRAVLNSISRYIVTPRVAKHRIFVWVKSEVLPDSATIAIARDDDYFFGVLHSYLHEIWSLRLGTWLGKGNDPRYTPTTTFETFPFPWPPGSEDAASPLYHAIAAAARQLHEERDAWLNPPDDLLNGPARQKLLRDRTLTNLYNAVEEYRQRKNGENNGSNGPRKTQTAAQAFAPRLAELHDTLDRAVLAAYGWDHLATVLRTPEGDEELLRCLLALNLARA